MSINLAIRFSHPDAVANIVRYQRIDNVLNPVWINVQPNPITSPAVVATNVPAGQYAVGSTPIYADGRSCSETVKYTPACSGLISISAAIQGGVIVVTYLAPPSAPKVRITVNYPNGGSSVANYVNTGTPISIGIPPGLQGDFTVSGQSVCDESSGFFSPPSSTVTVSNNPNNLSIISNIPNLIISNISGIGGYTLPSNVLAGNNLVGVHTAFFNPLTFTFSFTSSVVPWYVQILVNGTPIQCQNAPGTSSGMFAVPSFSVAATDELDIQFNLGACPP